MAETSEAPYWLIATPITSGYGPQDDWNSTREHRASGAREGRGVGGRRGWPVRIASRVRGEEESWVVAGVLEAGPQPRTAFAIRPGTQAPPLGSPNASMARHTLRLAGCAHRVSWPHVPQGVGLVMWGEAMLGWCYFWMQPFAPGLTIAPATIAATAAIAMRRCVWRRPFPGWAIRKGNQWQRIPALPRWHSRAAAPPVRMQSRCPRRARPHAGVCRREGAGHCGAGMRW